MSDNIVNVHECKFESRIINVIEDIATLKAMGVETRADMIRFDKRINGTLDAMQKHIKESDYWRDRVTQHDIRMKIYTWVFTTFHIVVITALIKLFLK